VTDALPTFRYHPDPLRTGSVRASADECERCGEARGYVYAGPTYAIDEIESICPWCIADGTAAAEPDAEFTTVDDAPEGVSAKVVDEVVRRTPGFAGWQQEHWLFHCADAAEFVGKAGWAEVSGLPDVVAALVADGWAEDALPSLDAFGDFTAYLFRCRHCGVVLAYADAA
jgi:uncharacterized protein CbrC (UPF0167 family)